MSRPSGDEFRRAMGQFASGVTIATTMLDGVDHAMTASAFCSVSLEPQLVLVCVEKSTRFHAAVLRTEQWGLSILEEGQAGIARWLSRRGRPLAGQLRDIGYVRGDQTGAALLDGALCWIECRTWATYDGGDHTVVVGEVLSLRTGSKGRPLVYFRGRIGREDATNDPETVQ